MASIKCNNHNGVPTSHPSIDAVKLCHGVNKVTVSIPVAATPPASKGHWYTGRNTQVRVDSRAHMAAEYYANLESKKATASIARKECSKCYEVKSLDLFHNRKASVDGKQSRCKECYKK